MGLHLCRDKVRGFPITFIHFIHLALGYIRQKALTLQLNYVAVYQSDL